MEYLFKNYQGSDKYKKVQFARIGVIVFTCFFCILFREIDYYKALNSENLAVTVLNSTDYKGKNYSEASQEMRACGFKNIKTKALGDLLTGWITKENTIESITIDGNSFAKGKIYDGSKSIVLIKYHSK